MFISYMIMCFYFLESRKIVISWFVCTSLIYVVAFVMSHNYLRSMVSGEQ